jgi:asparagine synthase (glutamine-hydrolysing)
MKPLYLYENNQRYLFSSEIKAFRPWFDFEINPFSISSYMLGFGGPTKGATFYKGVISITPGSYVVIEPHHALSRKTFFAMPDFLDPDLIEQLNHFSVKQIVDHVEELMFNSVESHMFADSAIGAYCSGGVDSSLLMAMATKSHSNLAIFHADVLGPWSEYDAAKALSKHLKLDLNVIDVKDSDFITLMPDVIKQYEYPHTYHPNCAPFVMVSRLAREKGVKGMLSGEGSDELFLGYPWLGRESLVNGYYKLGSKMRGLVHRIPELGKVIWPEHSESHKLVRDLFTQREIADDQSNVRRKISEVDYPGIDKGHLSTIDHLNYHLRTLLHRNDTQGMEASIESRFPFLDHDFVRTSVNLPRRYKLRLSPKTLEKAHPFIRDKWVIRKIADRWIPKQLSQRRKMGFWTNSDDRMQIPAEYFNDTYLREMFGLSISHIKSTLEDADQDLKLRLLHLDVWSRVCLMDQSLEEVREQLSKHISIRPQ